jgi:hypothetical protein
MPSSGANLGTCDATNVKSDNEFVTIKECRFYYFLGLRERKQREQFLSDVIEWAYDSIVCLPTTKLT